MNIKTHLTVLLISALLSCKQSNSPDFTTTPEDLVTINDLNLDKADTYLAKREYTLSKRTVVSDLQMYDYTYQKNNDKTKVYFQILKYLNFKNECKQVVFLKTGSENYSKLKEAIEKAKFEYLETTTRANIGTFNAYVRDGIKLEVKAAENSKELQVIIVTNVRVEPYLSN